jgi:NADP-dependent 3-hydroxy acid dehydrogenase YdfG
MGADLRGTVALVTGASSGIGAATAKDLAARGAAVAVVARRKDRLEALAAEITAAGGAARAIAADVTNQAQAIDAVQEAVDGLGRLDILVNNAGVLRRGPFGESPVSDWELMISVNLLGSLYCARAALPHLVRAAAGQPREVADLVNVSSLSGRTVSKNSAVYNATKHALNVYAETLRQETARQRVRVSLVEPAAVSTELFQADPGRPPVAGRGGFRRLGPADVADVIGYMVTRPAHVAVSELLVRPTEQER